MARGVDDDLERVSSLTLAHYEERAERFAEATRAHDVSQNITALLRHITTPPPYAILDFGCGPGRDLQAFTRLGHRAVGVDGCARFVDMARAASGCPVWHQDFLALALPSAQFDGIFANASLFHVPSRELPRVLGELHAALKPDGVLFSSNPRGNGEEDWNGGRYGVYHQHAGWQAFLRDAGFVELEHYYRPPDNPMWLASVWRRVAD